MDVTRETGYHTGLENRPPATPALESGETKTPPSTMENLTDRQREILDYLRAFTAKHGSAPARSEVARALGVKHNSTIDGHLFALMRKGWIEMRPGKRRFIRLLREELPVTVAGPIAAGEPILAEGRVTAHLPRALREVFSPQPDYFLEVRGDSMDKLGFRTGTIVAVRAQPTAENNDVVVARIDDEVTLKRFVRLSDRYVALRPESTNPSHTAIEVDLTLSPLEIDGVAVGALLGAHAIGGAMAPAA